MKLNPSFYGWAVDPSGVVVETQRLLKRLTTKMDDEGFAVLLKAPWKLAVDDEDDRLFCELLLKIAVDSTGASLTLMRISTVSESS